MAASGGDTVVPTNWTGLIMVAVVIVVIAAVTYFGMDMQFGSDEGSKETEKSLSVKDVFSASARREIAAAEPARVLSRAELAARAPEAGSDSSDDADAWAQPGVPSADEDWSSDTDSWDTQSDNWDSTQDHWDDVASNQKDAAESVAAAASPAPTPVKATQKPTPKPTLKTTPKPTVKPAATPKPSAKPVPKPTAAAQPRPTARKAPTPEALTAWWSDANGALSVLFAGTLDRGERVSDGIAVMFSEPVDPAQGNQHMRLTDESGSTVKANWKSGANPALLILEGLDAGRYTLSIGSQLQSQGGKSLAKDASGPVYVF